MATITILGAGMMGSAWCVPLSDRGHDVRLVGTHLDHSIIAGLKENHLHNKLKYSLPSTIRPYYIEELDQALEGCDVIGLGVSSAGIPWAGETLRTRLTRALPIVMISKGLELQDQKLCTLPELFQNLLGEPWTSEISAMAIAGPCIAGELARRVPTCVVITGKDGHRQIWPEQKPVLL
jgi:glycerol-3-phosphate dehydrogenase (NAD(P)+)